MRLRDAVARSSSATPEMVAMQDRIVEGPQEQLRESKPAEDLYAGEIKKIKQLEAKFAASEEESTK